MSIFKRQLAVPLLGKVFTRIIDNVVGPIEPLSESALLEPFSFHYFYQTF